MSAQSAGRLLFILVFTGFTILRLRYKRRYRVPAVGSLRASEGWFFSGAKLGLALVAVVATVTYVLPGAASALAAWVVGPWRAVGFSLIARLAGLAVTVAAVGSIRRTHVALGSAFQTTGEPRAEAHLVTDGPYAYVRNPMYASYLLLFAGAFLLTGDWLLCGSSASIIVLLILVRLPREEAMLAERYGETYRAYRDATPALIPRIPTSVRNAARRIETPRRES